MIITPIKNDADVTNDLLRQYYVAADPDTVLLEERLLETARNGIMIWVAVSSIDSSDREDLCQEALRRLLIHLREGRADAQKRIRFFRMFARTLTQHLLLDHVRTHSAKERLRLRLRFLASETQGKKELARWQWAGQWLYGLSEWKGQSFQETEALRQYCQDDTTYFQRALGGRSPGSIRLSEFLVRLFQWVGTPLQEVWLLAHLLTILPVQPATALRYEDLAQQMGVPAEQVLPEQLDGNLRAIEDRAVLQQLWQQIGELCLNQRAVILLKLGTTDLIALTGVLTPIAQIARALEMEEAEVHDLWSQLPLPDRDIAMRLGTTESYVQKMRSLCRQSLYEKFLKISIAE